MRRKYKSLTTLGLVLLGTALLACSSEDSQLNGAQTMEVAKPEKVAEAQDAKPEKVAEAQDAKLEEVAEAPKAKPKKLEKPGAGAPRRIGGALGGGIKIKARPSAGARAPAATTGPQQASPLSEGLDAPAAKGALTFEPGSNAKDFGSLIQGAVEHHTFTAQSTGEDPLVINSLNKSCGCTRAEIVVYGAEGKSRPYRLGEALPSGTKIGIESTFDTTNKSHSIQSNITLTTNDPRGGLVFSLHADVKPALTMNPRSINFTRMKSADVRKGQVVVTSEAYGKFKLALDPTVPLREMRVEIIPDAPDEEGLSSRWVVNVEGGPNLPEGTLNRAIKLVSNLEQSGKTLPDGSPLYFDSVLFVTGQVLGPVALSPPSVSFGLLRPGQVAARTSLLTVTAEDFSLDAAPRTALKSYGAEFPYPDDFEVTWERFGDSGDWTMSLTLLGIEQEGNGSFRGYVEVQIGHEAKETIELPFSGVIRGGVSKPGN
jgi:hypothetical protein